MKIKTILLICIMSACFEVNAMKLTQDQFTENLKSYSDILKDANQKYDKASIEKKEKELLFHYCRRLDIYHKVLKMVQDNPQLTGASGVEITIKDTLNQHNAVMKEAGISEMYLCDSYYNG